MYNKNIQRLEPVIAKVMNQLRGVFEDIMSKTFRKTDVNQIFLGIRNQSPMNHRIK